VLHFLVLAFAFAGADDFDGAAADIALVLVTDGHHFGVRLVGGHRVDRDEFAHAAGHRNGIAGLMPIGRCISFVSSAAWAATDSHVATAKASASPEPRMLLLRKLGFVVMSDSFKCV
jgi:hypothetical protein